MSDVPIKVDHERSMKGLLSVAIMEAVKLALIDSAIAPSEACSQCSGIGCAGCIDGEVSGYWTDEERAKFEHDIYTIPEDAIAQMDPGALARNVANRLLGSGGWTISGVYCGNATAREVMEASLSRPDQDHVSEVAFDFMRYFSPPEDE